MKRKDTIRKDSERSDETCSSQDTTSTNVSDNYNSSQTPGKINIIEESGASVVTYDLEDTHDADLTSSAANVSYYYEKTNNANITETNGNIANKTTGNDPKFNQYIQNNGYLVSGKQQLNKPKAQVCKCYSNRFSGENKPLLEQSTVSVHSANVAQDSKEANDNPIQIQHAKTYPRDMTCDAYNSCGRHLCGPKSNSNDAEANVKTVIDSNNGLKASYQWIRRIFVALAILDLFMIICVLTVVPSVAITRSPGQPGWTTTAPPGDDHAGYSICFDCADLEKDRDFSAETLRGVYRRDGSCCFKSITSVYLSLKQVSYFFFFCFSIKSFYISH